MGIDCAAHAGIHVWEDHYLCEIVDPATGAPRPDGGEGELVVSTLTREGLPLIRYRTHDLTRVMSRAPCACGRTHVRLDRLRGRTDDMVIFRGVNFYPGQVESILLGRAAVGHEYQIVLDRAPGGSDRMTILVETGPGFTGDTVAAIRRDLKLHLNLSPEVSAIPRWTDPSPPGQVGQGGRPPTPVTSDVDGRARGLPRRSADRPLSGGPRRRARRVGSAAHNLT